MNPGADFYSEQEIVINGNYFFTGAGSDAYFNNFAADTNCFDANYVPNQICRVSWSNTEIRVRVPVGSTSGPLVVMVGTKASNSAQFQVLSPYMGGLSPSSGPVNQYVTIGGLQFGTSPGRVVIGGITADIPACANYWTDTSIVIKVPAGLAPGSYPVQVFTSADKASNRLNFMVTTGPLGPGMCFLNPTCGPSGQSVAITGERFGASQGTSSLTFSTLTAAVSSWSDTAIAAAAPIFPSEGGYPIAVTVGGVRSNEMWFTYPCTPGGGATCNNNGVINPGEQCDGSAFPASPVCTILGQSYSCNDCQLSGCGLNGSCNLNDVADTGEQCDDTNGDGIDLRGVTCQTYSSSFNGGTLACANCSYDTSGCTTAGGPGSCDNDGVIDPGEQCDDPTLPAGLICTIPGQSYSCNNCQLSGCGLNGSCNLNDVADTGEQCDDTNGDGIDLNGATCQTYSPSFNGGTLTCSASCTYDTSACTGAPGGGVCDACGVGRSQLVGGVCTPVITTIQPSTSPVGSWVTIQGCYFGAASGTVTYSGNHAGLWPDPAICGTNTWTDTQIISEVPNINTADVTDDAQTGPVTVTRADGTQATHSSGINIAGSSHPNLCRLTPTSGIIGAAVNVTGNGFGATRQSQDYVSFGAAQVLAADYTSWAPTSAGVRVPAAAAAGNVNVTLAKGTSISNPLAFNVTNNGVGAGCDSNPDPVICAADDSKCNTGLYCDSTSCTCQIAPALKVTDLEPMGSDVCPNAIFIFTFDQLVDRNTINNNTFFVHEGNLSSCPPSLCLTNIVDSLWDVEDGDFVGNTNLESRVYVRPRHPLALGTSHAFLVRGGPKGVKSKYGAVLGGIAGATYNAGSEIFPAYSQSITTGGYICQIDHVTVTMTRGAGANAFSSVGGSDMFTCAKNNCMDDVNAGTDGSQHTWLAQAWDASTPPQALAGAAYQWIEHDEDAVFMINPLDNAQVTVGVPETSPPKNGSGWTDVGAHADGFGSATTTASVTVSLCENPWPTFPDYPFKDASTNFSFWYCRDAGASDTQTDDLPALDNPPVVKSGTGAGCVDCLKEFLFLRDDSKDAIGLRVYSNLDKLSLMEWYQTNVKRPGNPSSFTVDGFPAIRDGRSVYVLAPNISGGTYYTNVFLISYNDDAEGETIGIFNGLVATWRFLINFTDPIEQLQIKNDSKRMSDLGGIRKALLDYGNAHGICDNANKSPCVVGVATGNDSCPTGFTCQASYPKLAAGSYLPGQSTSRWPSWQATLGNALGRALPVDPLNAFPHACSSGGKINQTCAQDADCYTCQNATGGTTTIQCRADTDCPTANPTCNMTPMCVIPSSQCPAPLYDQQSCWNDTGKVFDCPDNSRIYAYQQTDPVDGLSFTLGANLEYLAGGGGGSVAECSMNYTIGP